MVRITLISHGSIPIWWLEGLNLGSFLQWCDDIVGEMDAIAAEMTLE